MTVKHLFKQLENLNKSLKIFYDEDHADKVISVYINNCHEGYFTSYEDFLNYLHKYYLPEFVSLVLNLQVEKDESGLFSSYLTINENRYAVNFII